jgi:ribosomal-protein-alanine N-acetyltransferase
MLYSIKRMVKYMNSEIYLRPWMKEDARQLAFVANNKNIWKNVRDSIPYPYTIHDAEKWIAHCHKQKPVVNFGVIYNAALVGSIGCVPKTDVYSKSIEIGYFIGEPYWNLGIATQAVRILVDYIEKQFDAVRLYAEVFSYNKASMHVLHKNGFYLEGIRRKSVTKNNVITDDYVWVKMLEK